jgi:hypothetical protein
VALRVRVLVRARSFWLVSYLARAGDDPSGSWLLEIGTIEWAAVPAVISTVGSRADLDRAFATVGWS